MHVLGFFFRTLLVVAVLVGAVFGILYRQDVLREAANLSGKILAKAHDAGVLTSTDAKQAPAKPAKPAAPVRTETAAAPPPAQVRAAEPAPPPAPSFAPDNYAPPPPVADVQMPAASQQHQTAQSTPEQQGEPQAAPPQPDPYAYPQGPYGWEPMAPMGGPYPTPNAPPPAEADQQQAAVPSEVPMPDMMPQPFPHQPMGQGYGRPWNQPPASMDQASRPMAAERPARMAARNAEPMPAATRDAWVEARRLFWAQDLPKAEQAYRKLVTENADEPDLPGELGNLYLMQGRVDEAVDQYYEAGLRALRGPNRSKAGAIISDLSRLDRGKAEALRRQAMERHHPRGN